jgi:PAS domain S-box-containing protein
MDQEAVAIAITVGDVLRVHFANNAFWRLFGARPDGDRGAALPDLAPDGATCGLFDALRRSHERGTMQRHEYRIDINHHIRLWDATITPLPHPVNEEAATLLQIIDLTDANRVREERNRLHSLAEQRAEQFAIAAESIDNGIVVIDKDGRVRRINSVGIALLDLDDQHADGASAPASEAVRRQIDLPPLHLALRGHSVRDYEHCVTRRDGQRTWLNVSSFPLYDQRGTVYGAMAAMQDVSERRQIDQIKEDFLSVTAHELRTPVTSLLGYTNLLVRRAEHGDWNDRDIHAIRMIETQVQRLTQLINGLVDVSRVQAGALELHAQPVELHALAQQAVALIRPKAPDHLLVVEGPAEPVVVGGDPQRLDQVVSHLIENALKFSPWGGTITVRVWADEEAHISVADVGIGIPEDAIGQLFERFYRAANVDPERISGLGVGLYLVKELVAAHEGRIEVQSAPDHGTTFEIILPLHTSYEADILRASV